MNYLYVNHLNLVFILMLSTKSSPKMYCEISISFSYVSVHVFYIKTMVTGVSDKTYFSSYILTVITDLPKRPLQILYYIKISNQLILSEAK